MLNKKGSNAKKIVQHSCLPKSALYSAPLFTETYGNLQICLLYCCQQKPKTCEALILENKCYDSLRHRFLCALTWQVSNIMEPGGIIEPKKLNLSILGFKNF